MLSIKDKAMKRDMLTNELDYKCHNLEEQNTGLADENQTLRREFNQQSNENQDVMSQLQLEVN